MSVVLVHGAWHGAWAWDGVVAELERLGVAVEAVELPFTGFADDAATARSVIERAGSGAVVCGHSYGGFVISAVARDLAVGHLVYLCAFMVDEGENPFPLWFSHRSPCTAPWSRPAVDRPSIRPRPRSASTPTPVIVRPAP